MRNLILAMSLVFAAFVPFSAVHAQADLPIAIALQQALNCETVAPRADRAYTAEEIEAAELAVQNANPANVASAITCVISALGFTGDAALDVAATGFVLQGDNLTAANAAAAANAGMPAGSPAVTEPAIQARAPSIATLIPRPTGTAPASGGTTAPPTIPNTPYAT